MQLIAHQAARFDVDPTRIGAMGLSVGGHLGANFAGQFTRAAYKPIDAADALSARLCIAAPTYAAILADQFTSPGLFGANSTAEMLAQHIPSRHVPADAPPHWLLHVEGDSTVPVANTPARRAALVERKIPVQTHLFEKGGHGFAIRFTKGTPLEVWPEPFPAYAKTKN